ncbi:MAG: MurR/RpiR family transcriptional regulator [Acidipropionibacterium sp.]|nr:MurR/RpiR family transcriptional regulator [Acidipropionibacterium sp.]
MEGKTTVTEIDEESRPAAVEGASPVEARIMATFPELTGQEQRAATTILEHLEDLATYSSADLSGLSGVSRPTLSRLYRRLGYRGFAELRHEARQAGIPIGPSHGVQAHLSQENRNISHLGRLADGRLQTAVQSIMSASDLVIVGYRNSYPVAMHLREQLVQLRGGIRLLPLPGQTVAEEMVGVGPGDTIVLVGLRRRIAGFEALLKMCVASRAEVILIADNSALRYADQVTQFLPCSLDSSGTVQLLCHGDESGRPHRQRGQHTGRAAGGAAGRADHRRVRRAGRDRAPLIGL